MVISYIKEFNQDSSSRFLLEISKTTTVNNNHYKSNGSEKKRADQIGPVYVRVGSLG